MRRLVLGTLTAAALAGLGVYTLSPDPLAGCEGRYQRMCLAAKRVSCAYEPGCVAAEDTKCQSRASTRCDDWRAGRR